MRAVPGFNVKPDFAPVFSCANAEEPQQAHRIAVAQTALMNLAPKVTPPSQTSYCPAILDMVLWGKQSQ